MPLLTRTSKAQMLSALPPGPLVDAAVRDLMSRALHAGEHPLPLPLNASPAAFAGQELVDSQVTLQVLAGLQDPAALAAALGTGPVTDLQKWAALVNPSSGALSITVPDVDSLDGSTEFGGHVPGFAQLTAPAVRGLPRTHGRDEIRRFMCERVLVNPETPDVVAEHWAWSLRPSGLHMLPGWFADDWRASSPAAFRLPLQELELKLAHAMGPSALSLDGLASLAIATPTQNLPPWLLEVLAKWVRQQAQDALGGRACVPPILPALLRYDEALWWDLLCRDGKPALARDLGARLYRVTGEDFGLWSVALDLLDDWDGSVGEWLAVVGSLNPAR